MLKRILQIFGLKSGKDYAQLVRKGAVILDVRSTGEYNSGHIKGSINIPLGRLNNDISKLQKQEPVITCCASGVRSGAAKSILKSQGFTEVYNGGGWINLQNRIS